MLGQVLAAALHVTLTPATLRKALEAADALGVGAEAMGTALKGALGGAGRRVEKMLELRELLRARGAPAWPLLCI